MRLSHSQIRTAIEEALNRGATLGGPRYYARDVWPDSVVYVAAQDLGAETLYEAAYKIGEDGAATLGESRRVEEKREFVPVVTFSAEVEGSYVYEGKVFELGSYPDREGFELNAEDADEVIANFRPVGIDLSHLPHLPKPIKTVLDGKLGQLTALRREGGDIHGSFSVPPWFGQAFGKQVPVSLAWDVPRKKVLGAALVPSGRIKDAVVSALFAHAEEESVPGPEPRKGDGVKKTLREKILAALFGEEMEDGTDPAQTAAGANPGKADQGTADEKDAVITRLTRERDEALAAARKAESDADTKIDGDVEAVAAKFAGDFVASGRAFPAEEPHVATLFASIARDDAAESGTALFSASGEIVAGNRLKAFKALCEARPVLPIGERVPATVVLYGTGGDAAPDPAVREKQLLALTPLGRQALDKKENK